MQDKDNHNLCWEVEKSKGRWHPLGGRASSLQRAEKGASYSDISGASAPRRLELYRLGKAQATRTHVASGKVERLRPRSCCWMVGSSTGWINCSKIMQGKLEGYLKSVDADAAPEMLDLGLCKSVKGWREEGGSGTLKICGISDLNGVLEGKELSDLVDLHLSSHNIIGQSPMHHRKTGIATASQHRRY